MSPIRFALRWKEELVAETAEGTLVFECTMGEAHVYFPDQALWQREVPGWAQPRWEEFLTQCTDWCNRNHIPISIVENTFVYQQR